MRMIRLVTATLVALILGACSADRPSRDVRRAGSPDTRFGNNGLAVVGAAGMNQARGLGVQADGSILVTTAVGLHQLTKQGVVNGRFGDGGLTETTAVIDAIALDVIGNALVATSTGSSPTAQGGRIVVQRYDGHGNRDQSFGGDGEVSIDTASSADRASALWVDPVGHIVVAFGGGETATTLARFDRTGDIDRTFGADGIIQVGVSGTALRGRNGYVVVGHSSDRSGEHEAEVVHVGDDGRVEGPARVALAGDMSLVSAQVVDADGQILVVIARGQAGQYLVRISPAGVMDPDFRSDARMPSVTVAVAVDNVGRYVVGGAERGGPGAVLRLLHNGAPDRTFGRRGRVNFSVDGSSVADIALRGDYIFALGTRPRGGDPTAALTEAVVVRYLASED